MKFQNFNKVNDDECRALDNINWNHVPVYLLEFCTSSFATGAATTGASVDQPAWIYLLPPSLPLLYYP